MPQFENAYVSLWSIKKWQLNEYNRTIDEENRVVTAYIESKDNQIFQIQVIVNDLRRLNGIDGPWEFTKYADASFEVKAFVDGSEAQSSVVMSHYEAREMDELSKVIIGPVVKNPADGSNLQLRWRFEKPAVPMPAWMVDDFDAMSLDDRAKPPQAAESSVRAERTSNDAKVGTIEVKIWRVALDDTETRPVHTSKISKAQALGVDIENTVGYTAAEPEATTQYDINAEHEYFTYNRLDPDDAPWMTFRFVYRSRAVLERLNIVPPAPKPDPKDFLRRPIGGRIDKGKKKVKPKSAIAAYLEKTLANLEAERKAEREREAARQAMEARITALEERLGINMPFRISDDLNEVIRYYEKKIVAMEMPALEEAVEELDLENNPEDSDDDVDMVM